MNLYPSTPFDSIGFALSGGGFRAAGFGLGVMSILEELSVITNAESDQRSPLLENVHFLSSTSGGTITCAVYAAAKAIDIPFAPFYYHLNSLLQGQNLLDDVFATLEEDRQWLGSKHRNPINAFALVYHKTLFASSPYLQPYLNNKQFPQTLNDLINSPANSHIKEVCFNATEFTTGLPFRFQINKGTPNGKGGDFGNANVSIHKNAAAQPWEILGKIRLADVLACSSCFPIGFEPLQFPEDFAYAGEVSDTDLKQTLSIKTTTNQISKSLALMDGGIVDNQGLDALLNANKRKSLVDNRTGKESFDLLIVSDVASHYMDPYQRGIIPNNTPWFKKTPAAIWSMLHKIWQKIPLYLQYAQVISILLICTCALLWYLQGRNIAIIILSLFAIALLVMINVIKGKTTTLSKSKIGAFLNEPLPDSALSIALPVNKFEGYTANKLMQYVQKRPISETAQWMNDRLGSGLTLFGTIFLKQVRRLIYYKLYAKPELFYKRIYNAIYTLTTTNTNERDNPPLDIQGNEPDESYELRKNNFVSLHNKINPISPEMIKVADLAYSMNTTLWFTREDESVKNNIREALIATGQFSTTYQLLQYTLQLQQSRHFNTLAPFYQARINDLLHQLEKWVITFNKDPYFLVNRYKSTTPVL